MEVGFDGIAPKRPRRISDMCMWVGALVSFCSKWSLDLLSLLPLPSREGCRDFLQFHQIPYHVLLGSLKGSCRTFLQHSAEASLHHAVKSLVRSDSRSKGASSQEGLPCTDLSLPHQKILRPNKIVLDDIDLRSPARLTFLHFDSLRDTRALHAA